MPSTNVRTAAPGSSGAFLAEPELTPEVEQLYDQDLGSQGYVARLSRLWATSPEALLSLSQGLGLAARLGGLGHRERTLLITAAASAMGDSYCALTWGSLLASATTDAAAVAVIKGETSALLPDDGVLVDWARRMALDPNSTTAEDVDVLRRLGYSDQQIFAITVYVALRLAFAVVNDTLGAAPDAQLLDRAPAAVLAAIQFGRDPAP